MIEVDHAVIEQVHQAGDGGERGADHEGERDRPVDVDAEQRRHLHVLLAGALRRGRAAVRAMSQVKPAISTTVDRPTMMICM